MRRRKSAEPNRTSGRFVRRAGAFLLREFREILPPTIFFLIGFNLIVLTTNLLVANYGAKFASFMIATASALIVAKALLVANAMPAIRRFDRAPLIRPILFKTVFYCVAVLIVRLLEQWIACWHHLVEFEVIPVIQSAEAAQRVETTATPPEPADPAT